MTKAREGRAAPAAGLLDSYVSPLLLRRLAEPEPIEPPEARSLPAAVAAIDVEGFSPMAESMSRAGQSGIEDLASLISNCFGSLVDVVRDYGGAAHTFPGDAVIAVWPVSEPSELAGATRLAAACARELTRSSGLAHGPLPLKAAVGAGSISVAHVGGFADRWELIVTGEALDQIADATQRARRGEVLLSRQAWDLLEAGATAQERDGSFVLEALDEPVERPPADAPRVPAERLPLLRAYLPDGLLAQADTGQMDWLAEFRRLSVIFTLLKPRGGNPTLAPELLHQSVQAAQQALYRYEGGLVEIGHDDKGIVLLAATGLPGLTHEDDADRAVLAAQAIHRSLGALAVDCQIGVATGRTFCGALGSHSRREYSVVGSVVNLAARLMGRADDAVLCDEATRQSVAPTLAFDGPSLLNLKGFPQAVPAFRAAASPSGEPPPVGPRRGGIVGRTPMVGRDPERRRIADWLGGLANGGGGLLAIRGEAGIGKSLLGTEMIATAREAGSEVWVGFCDTLNETVAYHPWRSVLEPILNLRGITDPAERCKRAEARVAAALGDAQLAPLLSAALPLEIPETSVTERMAGTVRSDNTRDLLAALIGEAARRHLGSGNALVIALEDTHWMDAASWTLVDRLRRSARELPLGIAITLRPVSDLAVAEACLGAPETNVVDLDVLSQEGIGELIAQRLGAEGVGADLAASVFQQSQGNPFFCQELVSAMKETGLVVLEHGVARLARREGGPASVAVPDSVSGVVESRIDRLSADLQLTIKAASILGSRVDPELLQAIHPVESRPEPILGQLLELAKLDLLRVDDQGRYFFKHAITREVAYNRLLYAQRRQLHRAMAEHLEGTQDEFASVLLFHHWRESGEVEKALRHVDATGASAMHQGHYQRAIELFEYGLKSCSASDRDASARWSQLLGEAQVAIGRHSVGRNNLELGLQGLGQPVPSGRSRVVAKIARELGRQMTHRVLPKKLFKARRQPGTRLTSAAEAYEQLGYIHYASGETLLGIHAAFKMLNLSERAEVSPVLARSLAAMALTVSVVPQRRLAALYERKAYQVVDELDDPLTRAYVDWIAGIRAAGDGRWDRVEAGAGGALTAATRLADWRLQMMSLATLASAAVLQGHFARALELSETQLGIATEQGNRLWEAWALNSLNEARQYEGDEEGTLARCQRALDILAEESDRTEEIRTNGMRATALLRLGRTDEALMTAHRTTDLIESIDLTAFTTYAGFSGVCEVMLSLAEEATRRGATIPPTLRKATQKSCASLKRFGRVFPVGRPQHGVTHGRFLRLQRRQGASQKALESAVAEAQQLGMPHEQALAQWEIGRCEWLPAERRREALERAVELLDPAAEDRMARQIRTELAR